jgi:integrase
MAEWVKRWGYEVSAKRVREGIYRLRSGGYLVRGRLTNEETGRRKTVIKALPDASLAEATGYRVEAMSVVRERVRGTQPETMRLDAYATSLFERKVKNGDLKSAKSIERWEDTLTQHLFPALGRHLIHELRYAHIEKAKDGWARRMNADPKKIRMYIDSRGKERKGRERISPRTANGWLSILRVITKQMTAEYELGVDPAAAVRDFDTSTSPTYTDEEPNSLLPNVAHDFLATMKREHPGHYAMTLVGFLTGLRPSSLRPLRRKEDVLWDENAILVRRSNAMGNAIMEKTKTGKRQRIELPPHVLEVLRWHLDRLDDAAARKNATATDRAMAESAYLFPSETGGMRSRSVLDKPFRSVATALDLKFKVTPKGMRRTFQDLARAAGVADLVTRSISGHATETMQQHYSTVAADEMRNGIGKILTLTLGPKTGSTKGANGGAKNSETTNDEA